MTRACDAELGKTVFVEIWEGEQQTNKNDVTRTCDAELETTDVVDYRTAVAPQSLGIQI